MKMIKNKALTLLLFTFAFFMVHDYVVQDLHLDTKCELSNKVCDKAEVQTKIHDAIDNIFNFNLEQNLLVETKVLSTQPSSSILNLSSNTNPVPQRPPLS